MDFGERLKRLRIDNGLTLEQVGDAVGVGKSTVRKWETGQIANMRRDKIAKLATALHTTPAYLMGWDIDDDVSSAAYSIPPGFQPTPELSRVPRVGRIACGEPITAEENIEDYDDVPASWHSDFTLLCEGESMLPRIQDGDIVAIHKQPIVENGEIAAVRVGTEATLKRVFVFSDHIELRAENPEYPTIIRIGEEMNDVVIEGKAVGLCRKI